MGWKCDLHEDNNAPPKCLPKIDSLNMTTIKDLNKVDEKDPSNLDLSGYQISHIGIHL